MEVHRLENGLTVITKFVPNKVVTIDCWVATGSANEDESNNGISHFLEHMMFKGTPKYGVGELDRVIMNVGGVWNAGTSKDFTHYYVTVAAPFFATALDAISDMIQNSLIDETEFEKEKQVILEEYRRKQDSPTGVLYDELYETAYERGPYRQTVLGSFDSISKLRRDQMFDYYQRYYTPENMAVMVVGDIPSEAAAEQVAASFAGFSRRFNPLSTAPRQCAFSTAARRAVKQDVNETYMALAFPAPSIEKAEEVFALDLASTILGDGRSSRLYQTVKEQQKLAHTVACGSPTHRYESIFYVFSTLEREDCDAAALSIRAVLKGLADAPPTIDELAKAKRIIANDFHFGTETNTGQSGMIGYYYTLTGSTTFLETYIHRVTKVTPEQVAAAASRYLTAEPTTVIVEPIEEEEMPIV